MVLYMVWNAYHFGMQNFGILTIYRVKAGTRRVSAGLKGKGVATGTLDFCGGTGDVVIYAKLCK
jgi:hypothetical protein